MSRTETRKPPTLLRSIKDSLATARWRAQNRPRTFDPGDLPAGLRDVGRDLRERGFALASFEDVFGTDELLNEALEELARLPDPSAQDPENTNERKPFLHHLLPERLSIDTVWLRIALHPNVLAVANHYMRMRSLLRAANVWLTLPVPGPATETQLWHRDDDDMMNVKLFLYLNDVKEEQGPFCYAPGTHPLGDVRLANWGRVTDADFERLVPRQDWVVCSGSRGTVVFADTCGFHKQLKAVEGKRILLMAQFTSGTPHYPRSVEVTVPDGASLSMEQKYAISEQI